MIKLFILVAFSLYLYSSSIQALAKSISLKNNNIIELNDDVVLFYENYSLFSNNLTVNKQKKSIDFKNGVTILGDKLSMYSKEVKFCNNQVNFKNMFAIEPISKTWIKTTSATKKINKYSIKDFVISSCDIKNPTWKIYVQDGEYDVENSFLTLRNSYLLLGGIKVFYIPYITVPLNNKRKSGLLRPNFGISNSDGFLYFQPIFINLSKSYDLEINPQYRSKRGVGLFSTFRFVDTNDSKGYVRVGYFKNKSSYVNKNSLTHNHHQGAEIYYKNESVGMFDSFDDKLFIDYKLLNDIDYINTQERNSDYVTDKLVKSNLNYIAYDEDNYFGVYINYFKDTSKTNNDDTLQTLPLMQYHRFSNKLYKNNFLYSLDFSGSNFTRKSGINASEVEFALPLVYSNSYLKDFVNISVSQNLFLNQVNYYNDDTHSKKARFARSYFQFDIASDLVKKYDSLFHTLHLNLGFTLPNYKKQSGNYEDFVKINNQEKSLSLEATEFFYKDGEDFLTHRVNQTYYFERENEKGDLINELELSLDRFNFTNKLTYSYIYDKVTQSQTTMEYDKANDYNIDLLHTYSSSPLLEKSNFVSLKTSKDINELYKIFANIEYDYENRFFKSAKVGWSLDKRCLKYNIYYKYKLTPDASQNGVLREHGIYFDFELTPLGSLRYYYSRDTRGFEENE